MAKREIVWKADDAKYREWCNKIVEVKREQKELGKDIASMKHNATVEGCNPKVLNQMVRLEMMKPSDKDALEEALEK